MINPDIIQGADGQYIIKAGALLKITKIETSSHAKGDYSNGWVDYTIEDSSKIRVVKVLDIEMKNQN